MVAVCHAPNQLGKESGSYFFKERREEKVRVDLRLRTPYESPPVLIFAKLSPFQLRDGLLVLSSSSGE